MKFVEQDERAFGKSAKALLASPHNAPKPATLANNRKARFTVSIWIWKKSRASHATHDWS